MLFTNEVKQPTFVEKICDCSRRDPCRGGSRFPTRELNTERNRGDREEHRSPNGDANHHGGIESCQGGQREQNATIPLGPPEPRRNTLRCGAGGSNGPLQRVSGRDDRRQRLCLLSLFTQ